MKLNYKVQGAGEPIIILHGLFGSLDNWETIARKLSEDFQVFTIDQRNHGKSPHAAAHSYKLMSDDLLEFMDTHGIEQANLLGHSMGGKTVMQFTIEHPNRVKRLISADMGMESNTNGNHDDVFDALFKMDLNAITKRSDAETMMEPLMPNFSVRQFLLKSLNRLEDGSYAWKFNLDVLYNDYTNVLAGIEASAVFQLPVLFIRGTKSGYISEANFEAYKATFPNAELVSLNAGHWLHAEVPNVFLAAVKKFIETT